jgi:hydroxyacylglutathione hydrolase
MLKYEKLILGELQTNCYLVWDEETKEVAIIDPADDGVGISEHIQELQLKPIVVLATHGHFDHLLGALDLKLIYNIPLAVSKYDLFLLKRQRESAEFFLHHKIKTININKIDIDLDKVKSVRLGEERLVKIITPGHTPGGICFYSAENRLLFSGDTLFAGGSIGNTDHIYSSLLDLRQSVRELINLPDKTTVLPGHGESDTILNCREQLANLWS